MISIEKGENGALLLTRNGNEVVSALPELLPLLVYSVCFTQLLAGSIESTVPGLYVYGWH